MTKPLEYLVWPVLLGAFLAAFQFALLRGYDPGVSLLVITIGHFIVIALLETKMPARKEWDWRRDGQVINDLIHGALLDQGGRLGAALLTAVLAEVAARISTANALSASLWPTEWPLVAQLALAILLYDFVDYWKHRAYHAWTWAWPIHALHHNPDRMNVFKAGRLHFIEATIRALVTSAPLVALGAPAEIFFWLAALANAVGDQNHWNVRSRLPRFLDAVIATPNAHWLHHARDNTSGTANLSSFTLLFDHVFGTFRRQPDDRIEEVGIVFDPLPRHLPGQIVGPFIWPWLVRTSFAAKANQVRNAGVPDGHP